MQLLTDLIHTALPELILMTVASVLFLLGISKQLFVRKLVVFLALSALVVVFVMQFGSAAVGRPLTDSTGSFRVTEFSQYVKLVASAVGVLLVLLAWPTNPDAAGNPAMNLGGETGEFFAMLLLSISGIFVVAGANDLILLFLGIELASIPTYIMVSTSRNIPAAQEAGVKYFFLGAMAAAILLFGFSFLYGVTGSTNLVRILESFRGGRVNIPPGEIIKLNSWQMLAAIMVVLGLAFKIAAFPLHFYVGDVYQGAATPVTALLSFVPKTSGFVALIKILFVISGGTWGLPVEIAMLLWILAVATMTIGNVLGLMQTSVKRVFAYSSIAHTGYMLTGLATLAYGSKGSDVQEQALQGVLFYLAAYGVMNAAAFGVLILFPSKSHTSATSAETYDDLAGQGRKHFSIGLAMALACFSLTGMPLTVGFLGKVFLMRPALAGENYWLVIITMANAAMSAGYYLKIVGTLFIPAEHVTHHHELDPVVPHGVFPILLAVALSAATTLMLGAVPQATQLLTNRIDSATKLDTNFRYTPAAKTPVMQAAALEK